MMKGHDGRTIWCDAKTLRQINAVDAEPGCLKPAMGVTPDGHNACRVHLENAPNGWNK